ncbi:MAG: HesA/MoeB/ThiF family protein [Candidatus Omnitrophota bacterium]
MLTEQDQKRYGRQIMMDGWGEAGQEKLKTATVFVAGAGGLGSPVSIYLAVAGIGHIRLCDFDSPDLTNLNRQILHDDSRLGINKARSGQMTLERINPDIRITAVEEKITEESVDRLVGDAAVIVDCMDNFDTRFVLNRCAIRKKIPLVHGSVWGMDGRMTFIRVPETPCLQCLYTEGPPKQVFPVLGATPAVIGSMEALEVVKYLTGVGKNLKNELLVWEGSTVSFRKFKIRKDPACPACGAFSQTRP